jgi:hypothetical protein
MQFIVKRLISWLKKGQAVAVFKTFNPDLILVVKSNTLRPKAEKNVKKKLLRILKRKTFRNIYNYFFNVTIILIFTKDKPS